MSSPSKAALVASKRKPMMERRIYIDDAGDFAGIEPIELRFEDGLLTFREAWTGKIDE